MSLQTLPTELCLQIITLLSSCDEQCLRLTCSRFLHMIKGNRNEGFSEGFWPGMVSDNDFALGERSQRFPFVSRLMKPGDMFSDNTEFMLCIMCLFPRPLALFDHIPIRINDEAICRDCLVGMMLQARRINGWGYDTPFHVSFRGKRLDACLHCSLVGKVVRHETVHLATRPVQEMCEGCHALRCHDSGCPGWDEDFVKNNPRQFFTGDKLRTRDDCKCRPCFQQRITPG